MLYDQYTENPVYSESAVGKPHVQPIEPNAIDG